MIEDDIKVARMGVDIIDISDSLDFVKDMQDGILSFYKNNERKIYINYVSVDIAKKKYGNGGEKHFIIMQKEIKKNNAKKVGKEENMRLLKQLQAEKNYRYQYFG